MVGTKRRSNRISGKGSSNAPPAASRGGPSIYLDMLAEAGVEGFGSRENITAADERPIKRRRPGERTQPTSSEPEAKNQHDVNGKAAAGAAQEETSDHDDDDAEFLDVPLPPAQVQTMEKDSDDDSDDDDEDDDLIFEDVNLNGALERNKDIGASSSSTDPKELELNLTAQKAAITPSKRNAADRRKPITREERERRLDVHKMHLLCLVSHAARRNHWCNDALVQDALRPHLTAKTADYLTPEGHLPQFGQAESLRTGLKQAADMWRTKFEVTERGLRRARWAEDTEELARYQLPDMLETCADRSDFRHAAATLQGSRDVGAQLYCALLRSVGVQARLVCSLQPLAFGNSAPTLPKVAPAAAKGKTPTRMQRAEEMRAQIAQYKDMAAAPHPSPTTAAVPSASTARRRLGHPNAASHRFEPAAPPPSPAKPAKSFAAPVRLRESAHPVYWVEVLDTGHQKWQPADPVVTHTFWKPRALEPPITDKENCMSYVVAFDEDGTARDVTVRYAKAYAAKTRRMRVDGGTSTTTAADWWRKAMRPFTRRQRTDLDQIEDAELAGVEAREPMPRNVQDFKNHPVFALPRHLRRHEVLAPTATPSGTVSSGNKGPLEKIYRRRDVRIARSADKWFRMGRVVRPMEIPAKWLPKIKRAKAPPRHGRFSNHDDDDGYDRRRHTAEEEAEDAAGVPIYTEDQTELYVPAPVRNGKVPRNKFGNVEVYVPSMIPRGGVHIAHDLAAQASKVLGVDYAPALTGFQFQGRQGTAVLKGVVVAAEYEAGVWAVIAGLEDVEQEREEEARALVALKLWRRLLMGLRIRERIWSGVDEGERRAAEEEADRVLEEADAVEGDGDGEEDAGESDATEEFDMIVDGDDAAEYGGGFLVD